MLTGKVAVVTGGTRGIGYAIVETYLKNNAKVVLFGSREETVNKALERLQKTYSADTVAGVWPDLSNPASVQAAIDKVIADYGKIDILVNNAGISDSLSIFDYDENHFKQVMDLNVNGLFNCIRATVGYMKDQQSGCIINTSSMVSISGQTSGVAYPTSKFAVNGITISLARELGPYNIRVNAVAPGITNTDMVSALPQEMMAPLIQNIPLKRIGEPEDIANGFLFLASDLAAYVTGDILHMDGAMRI